MQGTAGSPPPGPPEIDLVKARARLELCLLNLREVLASGATQQDLGMDPAVLRQMLDSFESLRPSFDALPLMGGLTPAEHDALPLLPVPVRAPRSDAERPEFRRRFQGTMQTLASSWVVVIGGIRADLLQRWSPP